MTSFRLPDSVSIRPLQFNDIGPIVDLYAACMAVERNIGPMSAEGYASWLRLARSGYGRDFIVAMDGSDLIGVAESSLRPGGLQLCRFVKIVVHPARRRRGLGTTLLRAVVDQGPVGPSLLIESLPRPAWEAGLGFVSRFGFNVTEVEIIMRCPVVRPVQGGPAGLAISRAENGVDAKRIADIHNAAYRDEAGFVPSTEAETAEPSEGTRIWTARLNGQVVAFAIVEQEEGLTWLESLAVDPPFQARRIGAALATQALLGEGVGEGRPAGLNVSASNTAARKLYGRLGFEQRFEMPRYGILRDDLLARLAG